MGRPARVGRGLHGSPPRNGAATSNSVHPLANDPNYGLAKVRPPADALFAGPQL